MDNCNIRCNPFVYWLSLCGSTFNVGILEILLYSLCNLQFICIMKTTIFSLILIALSITLHGQKDQTLIGKSGLTLTGVWGGSTSYINGFEDDFDLYGGGYFSFEINKALLLGWSNNEVRTSINDGANIHLKTNDFLLGYSPISYRSLHPYFYTLIGTGTANYENEGTDRILSIQPSVALELNILRWFRLSFEGGYRFISGSDFVSVSDQSLSSPFVGLRLKFGWSWGR